ncbi:MAG: hypothetical protein JKY93_02270 [Gammaproteobacteria bacterium]|nr:hypothetical protein [Gammaproteobacteria bacterium]
MAINAKFDRYKIPQTLDEVIERAAEHLKEGWNLIINIEKEGCVVTLQDPDMTEFSCDGGDGIRSDINEGICISNGFTSTD